MMALINMELNKALKNKWFVIAVGVGFILAVMGAFPYIIGLFASSFVPAPDKFYNPEFQSCFNAWMSIDQSAPSLLFYQTAPLLAVIPYAWSLSSELKDGYIAQVYSRTRRSKYTISKYIAVFCTAGLVAALPQLLNFLLLACFYPGYLPQIDAAIYTAVFSDNVGSWLFYNMPLLHLFFFCAVDFGICGVWGGFVYALSYLVRNRVVLLVAPFLALLLVQFANDRIFLALGGLNGFDIGLFNNLRASTTSRYAQDGWIVLLEMSLLLLTSLIIGWFCRKKDVL